MKALDLVEAKQALIEAYEADDFTKFNDIEWSDYNDNILFTSFVYPKSFEMHLPNGEVILVEPICKNRI